MLTLRFSLFAALLTGSAFAQDIEPFHAEEVKPVQAQEVKPFRAEEAKPAPQAEVVRPLAPNEAKPADGKPAPKVDLSAYYGTWRTKVAGAVWEGPSTRPGYNVLHVSAGARAGDLVIKKNGTYTWQSYGGKKGRWEKADGEYPVVLVDTDEHKRWLVRFDPRNPGARELLIWDGGSFSYEGRR